MIVILVIGVNLLGDGLRDRPAGTGARAFVGKLFGRKDK
jgi:peptide/nickel transport system permease protein